MGCDIDVQLGKRLRRRRQMLGLTQQAVGAAIGLSCQQIQKYECGSDRMSAACVWRLAAVLDSPVSYFYGADSGEATPDAVSGDGFNGLELLDLVSAYNRLSDRNQRQVFAMVRTLTRPCERSA